MPLILPHGFLSQQGGSPIVPDFRGAASDTSTSASNPKIAIITNGPAVEALRPYIACVVWAGSVAISTCELNQFGESAGNGETMTPITSQLIDSSNFRSIQFFKVERSMPGGVGNTCAIISTFPSSVTLYGAALWDLGEEGIDRLPVDTANDSGSGSVGARSAAVTVGAGGCILAGYASREDSGTAAAVTWTNATERFDAAVSNSLRHSFADISGLNKGARTITATPADTEDQNVLQLIAF